MTCHRICNLLLQPRQGENEERRWRERSRESVCAHVPCVCAHVPCVCARVWWECARVCVHTRGGVCVRVPRPGRVSPPRAARGRHAATPPPQRVGGADAAVDWPQTAYLHSVREVSQRESFSSTKRTVDWTEKTYKMSYAFFSKQRILYWNLFFNELRKKAMLKKKYTFYKIYRIKRW